MGVVTNNSSAPCSVDQPDHVYGAGRAVRINSHDNYWATTLHSHTVCMRESRVHQHACILIYYVVVYTASIIQFVAIIHGCGISLSPLSISLSPFLPLLSLPLTLSPSLCRPPYSSPFLPLLSSCLYTSILLSSPFPILYLGVSPLVIVHSCTFSYVIRHDKSWPKTFRPELNELWILHSYVDDIL